MLQWKSVCGFAALCAVGLVQGKSIELDKTQNTKMIEYLDSNFPGVGARYEAGTSVPQGPTSNSESDYQPGTLHSPTQARRRLEVAKSIDMKKLESFFGLELETDITKLAVKCEANPMPWPGGYWPTYADSINYCWAKNSPSPAEKYATAFGYDVKSLMDTISAKKGVDSMSAGTKCTSDAVCKEKNNGSVCAKRKGKNEGYCVPKWFGICHAWAPAAILEAEPVCQVKRNGTVFEPYDIKALITLAYDGSKIPTIFTGTRFNGIDNASNITDQYGRYWDERRRDISPGFFHIAVTNLLSRFNQTFIIDIAAGNEVWNQPVRSYEILRLSWTTPTAAAKKYFKVNKYPFNDAATKIAVVTTRLSWIIESGKNGPLVSTGLVDKSTRSADYDYILETDETYRILGGEWLYDSKVRHCDFLWVPAGKPDNTTVTPVGLVYSEIEGLLIESTKGDCKPLSTNGKPASTHTQPPSNTEGSVELGGSLTDSSNSTPEPRTQAPQAENLALSTNSSNSTTPESPPAETPPSNPSTPSPAETPAEETPPAETPPAETPPAETPAEETPPAETAAEETPPAETPPAETSAEETPAAETPAEETPPSNPSTPESPAETPAAETPPSNPGTPEPPAETPP